MAALRCLNAMHRPHTLLMRRFSQRPSPPAPGQFVASVVGPVRGQPIPCLEAGGRVIEPPYDAGKKIGIRTLASRFELLPGLAAVQRFVGGEDASGLRPEQAAGEQM